MTVSASGKVLFSLLSLSLFATTFFPHTLVFFWWKQWIAGYVYILALIGFLVILNKPAATKATLDFIGKGTSAIGKLPEVILVAAAAAVFVSLTYYLSGRLFDFYPAELDSMAQYAGAKIFAKGHWFLPSHPLKEFFETDWFFNNGKFFTFYPPGHMLLLSLGHKAGVPYLVNPVLGALTLVATYFFTKEVAGNAAARLSILLFLISPFIVFLSSEYDNRATALLMATLFTLFYIRFAKYVRLRDAFFAGLALGFFFITRPQTVMFFILPFAIYSFMLLMKDGRKRLPGHLVAIAAAAPFILFFLYYNLQTTGNAFQTGYQMYFGETVAPFAEYYFYPEKWGEWPTKFTSVVKYMQLLHEQLFGWPVSSLFLAFLPFFFYNQRPFCILLAATFFVVFIGLTFSKYLHDIFGPRYLYEISTVIIVLTAVSIYQLPELLGRIFSIQMPPARWVGMFMVSICIMTGIGLSTTIKDRYIMYGNNYRQSDKDFIRRVSASVKSPAVVLISNPAHLTAVVPFAPWWDDEAPIIFARDRAHENHKIINFYQKRNVYRASPDGRVFNKITWH